MCTQDYRPHRCRHCGNTWNGFELLQTCPEGDHVVLTHGYCAAILRILSDKGHAISLRRNTAELEDMCQDCKARHEKNWEDELRGKVGGAAGGGGIGVASAAGAGASVSLGGGGEAQLQEQQQHTQTQTQTPAGL